MHSSCSLLVFLASPSSRVCTPPRQNSVHSLHLWDPDEILPLQLHTDLQFPMFMSHVVCPAVQAPRRDFLTHMQMLEVTPFEPCFIPLVFLVVHITPGALLGSISIAPSELW